MSSYTKASQTTIDITAAELAGANSRQRPDLIESAFTFRTPDGNLYQSDGATLVPATLFVTAEDGDLKAGSRKIPSGGKSRNRRLLARGLSGDVTLQATTDANFVTGVTSGGLSTMTRIGLATDFDAVRIFIANYSGTNETVTNVLLATPDSSGISEAIDGPGGVSTGLRGAGAFSGGVGPSTVGDTTINTIYGATAGGYASGVNSVSKSFMVGTFDKGASLTKVLPPKAAVGFNTPSWTATDWIPIASKARQDGGSVPLLDVFISWAVGANVTLYSFGSDAPAVHSRMANDAIYPRMWRTMFASGQVTNIASFSAVQRIQPKTPAIIVQYRSRKDGVQVMMIGDSIYEGIGQTNVHTNFSVQAALGLHTSDVPVEILPLARISQHSEDQMNHARQLLPHIKPTVLLAQSLSTNRMNRDTNQALVLTARASVGNILNEADEVGAIPVVIGITPTTTAAVNYGAADAFRIAANAELATMLPENGGVFVPLDDVLGTGGVVGGQLQLGAALSSDGIHLNDTAHPLVKVPVQAGLQAAVDML